MYRVIALDPGGTTGWATYTQEDFGEPRVAPRFVCGQLGPEDHHEPLMTLLEMQCVDQYVVVCESFEFRQGAQRANINLVSKEYIGVTKLYNAISHTPVVFQTASKGKGFVSDDKIKKLNLWHPGWKHAMDAYRHLLYYLVNVGDTQAAGIRDDILQTWR